jgi:HB1, ASXL, restriction endonuclease HTH domain
MPAKKKPARATPATKTKTKTPAASTPKPPAPAAAPTYSALDAAAQVLRESGQPMSCAELIAQMASKGYWASPLGTIQWPACPTLPRTVTRPHLRVMEDVWQES